MARTPHLEILLRLEEGMGQAPKITSRAVLEDAVAVA